MRSSTDKLRVLYQILGKSQGKLDTDGHGLTRIFDNTEWSWTTFRGLGRIYPPAVWRIGKEKKRLW